MGALFTKPKIPNITAAQPPTPQKNTMLEAEMAQAGRQQGLLATLFGYKSPSGGQTGTSGGGGKGHQLTGQG